MNSSACQLTEDTLFDGRLVCRQYSKGYRFSLDAILAAHFCRPLPNDHVLDLGCGCGVISLILAYRHPNLRVTGLELQPELADLAGENISANTLDSRVSVINGDLRKIGGCIAPESFDMVVCNPPYRDPGTGRVSPSDQRARARHEIDATLDEIVSAAAFAVKNRGRTVFVYPAERAVLLIHSLKRVNLEPKRIQPVYSYPGKETASLMLIDAVKNGGVEVHFLAPFYIYREKNGPYTLPMQELYT